MVIAPNIYTKSLKVHKMFNILGHERPNHKCMSFLIHWDLGYN